MSFNFRDKFFTYFIEWKKGFYTFLTAFIIFIVFIQVVAVHSLIFAFMGREMENINYQLCGLVSVVIACFQVYQCHKYFKLVYIPNNERSSDV